MASLSPRALLSFVAAGCAGGLASIAVAQPTLINISGATLLENFVSAPASTNDFIDVDGNGISGQLQTGIQQLAPQAPPVFPFPAGAFWSLNYRSIGSINGFRELQNFGRTFVTTDAFDVAGIRMAGTSAAYYNTLRYVTNSATASVHANTGNPGALPIRSDTTTLFGTFAAPNTGAAGGVRIDIAVLDVPSRWAVQITSPNLGTPPFTTPGAEGYGTNPLVSRNKVGTTAGAGLSNQLPGLAPYNLFDPGNPGAADDATLFDNPLAFAPIAPMVNYGTGRTQVQVSELQHLYATGRMPDGENLIAITRDVGSGTRNAWCNTIGLDPSYCRGDNIGALSALSAENLLGPNFIPTNKGSNGNVETTVLNTRLGYGYAGAERGVAGGWIAANRAETNAVQNDFHGGTEYSRPSINEVLDNSVDGYVLGGPAALVTIGDPLAESVADGGLGLTTPQMRNAEAAAYLNNIRQSVLAFEAVPGGDASLFMPGELLATQFILTGSLDNVPNFVTPTQLDVNPGFNLDLQDYTRGANILANPVYVAFNLSGIGRVPTRTAGVSYSDGVLPTAYQNLAGVSVTYGGNLTLRNKIAGDFDGDGLRTPADIDDMVAAWRHRNGGPVWVAPAGTGQTQANGGILGAPGTDIVLEVIGDFNGDGNFNAADVRYGVDGLFLYPSALEAGGNNLNRKQAFIDLDAAFGGNFFGTTLATPAAYTDGASRCDVAGAAGTTPGFAPVGHNGTVNAADIDYVLNQFVISRNPALPDRPGNHILDGQASWADLSEAIYFDLSADMNGDLNVDSADVAETLTVLGTVYGDFNLDGVYDNLDRDELAANFGEAGWANGDGNGDGVANVYDLPCKQDYNLDGSANPDDLGDFITDYYTVPHPSGPSGYAYPCPDNIDYPAGYKTAYTISGEPQCFEPNPDNLGDYITDYFGNTCS
ncbi:MAG: hypothetical protein ACKVS8_08020 [Phycisphaerales bacterium]